LLRLREARRNWKRRVLWLDGIVFGIIILGLAYWSTLPSGPIWGLTPGRDPLLFWGMVIVVLGAAWYLHHVLRRVAGKIVLRQHRRVTTLGRRAGWLDRSWRIYTEYTDLEDNFNAEVGFVPRVGIQRSKLHLEYNPRPDILGIRMMMPMWNVEYLTDQTGRLVTRRLHHMVGVRMDDGGFFNVWYNDNFERLERDFEIQPGVVIPAGRYNFGDWHFSYRSDPSRPLFASASRWRLRRKPCSASTSPTARASA
jgi:hypothetical protein